MSAVYEKMLRARFAELDTDHSFDDVLAAKQKLETYLSKFLGNALTSVAITLNQSKSDFLIEVGVDADAATHLIPPDIDGISVRPTVTGQIQTFVR